MNPILVVYNSFWSNEESQKLIHSLLPKTHEYGDRSALLEDGTTLLGRAQHDAYASPELRIKTRKRCTLVLVEATHMGANTTRMPLSNPMNIMICFSAIPDWHASGLDAESLFLRPMDSQMIWPRIGPYSFNFCAFLNSMYEDLVMSLQTIRNTFLDSEGLLVFPKKAHVKIVPLGVGPTIKTRYGEYLGPILIPAYLLALQYACNLFVDDSWVDTLEFVDHTYGQLSPLLNIRKVHIMSGVSRDAFDFTGSSGLPVLIAPCDAFCKIGGLPGDKTLAATIANNSNLRDVLRASEVKFASWP